MSVTLKLTFESIEKAQEFLGSKINAAAPAALPPATPVQKAEPDPAATPNPGSATPAAESAKSTGTENAAGAGKGKGGKGKKAEPAAPDSGVTSAASPAPAAPAVAGAALTHADVTKKLVAVNEKFGADGFSKVADLLAPFGVQKVKDLKPEQYAEVVKAADAVLA